MTDYTPTTKTVRERFADGFPRAGYSQALEDFDRWLAEYTRQQREEAYNEGVGVGQFYAEDMTFAPLSPYRYRKETS